MLLGDPAHGRTGIASRGGGRKLHESSRTPTPERKIGKREKDKRRKRGNDSASRPKIEIRTALYHATRNTSRSKKGPTKDKRPNEGSAPAPGPPQNLSP